MSLPSVITRGFDSPRERRVGRIKLAALLSWIILTAPPLTPGVLAARKPTYSEVFANLQTIWQKRYPVQADGFEEYTGENRILKVTDKNQTVYYYRFIAVIPVMARQEDESLNSRGTRKAEFWVRYRSWTEDPFDVTFARQDLLPGSNRTWHKN